MRIRPARKSDVSELARLWLEFGSYYAELDSERFKSTQHEGARRLDRGRAAPPVGALLVAEIDGQIAGYAGGAIIEPHPNADWKMLTDAQATQLGIKVVQTSEAHRRKGVATALIQALESWGSSQGAEIVLAETDIHSPVAIPFWENADGYERTSVRFRRRLS